MPASSKPENTKPIVVGYCEFGYRLFLDELGRVTRMPIPWIKPEIITKGEIK